MERQHLAGNERALFRIIGKGKKVIWDLSNVKTGTYTITADADDGCGVCGKTVTKEIKIIECPNCQAN